MWRLFLYVVRSLVVCVCVCVCVCVFCCLALLSPPPTPHPLPAFCRIFVHFFFFFSRFFFFFCLRGTSLVLLYRRLLPTIESGGRGGGRVGGFVVCVLSAIRLSFRVAFCCIFLNLDINALCMQGGGEGDGVEWEGVHTPPLLSPLLSSCPPFSSLLHLLSQVFPFVRYFFKVRSLFFFFFLFRGIPPSLLLLPLPSFVIFLVTPPPPLATRPLCVRAH